MNNSMFQDNPRAKLFLKRISSKTSIIMIYPYVEFVKIIKSITYLVRSDYVLYR